MLEVLEGLRHAVTDLCRSYLDINNPNSDLQYIEQAKPALDNNEDHSHRLSNPPTLNRIWGRGDIYH